MTIKKRLFISNILMLVIPAVLAILMLASGLLFFLTAAFPHTEYKLGFQGELTEIRYYAVSLLSSWLEETDVSEKGRLELELSRVMGENGMCAQLIEGPDVVLQTGKETLAVQSELRRSLDALDGSGVVSDGVTELFGTQLIAGGNSYQVYLYNPVITLSHDTLKAWVIGIGFVLVVLLLFAVFLTNRFLTRFIFRRISEPLQILVDGVRQIRDGNLTHRIEYRQPDEFQEICDDFNDMAKRLQDSVERSRQEEESRKELLAGISHDIRSPLTAIRAYVEGLLDGIADTPDKQQAYLQTIREKAVDIDEMVKKLFLFSKMDMGEYPYYPETLNVSREIRDFIQASSEEYRRRGLKIVIESIPPDAVIDADPAYFRSILMNLLDNSAKYKVKKVGTALISGGYSGKKLVIYVDDDGPGVPPEALPKLFDVFYRSDPARKNSDQGSGLGLAIVSKAVERMGGSVRGENLTQGGLRIALELPLKKEVRT